MTVLEQLIPPLVRENLKEDECTYLQSVFDRYQGYPTLHELWQLMDEQWQTLRCDPLQIDERVSNFYSHPVWLLNGLFIEQDPESLANRHAFTNWVVQQSPVRLADFGGGFGSLARTIGTALPHAFVDVVDPHPHPAAISLTSETQNVRFVPELNGEYDLIIATDVFEHVSDPIALTIGTANHLRIGGSYLIANCFAPVIACHLPQLFHLSIGWDQVMRELGLQPRQRVKYGRAYTRIGSLNEQAARNADALARVIYAWVRPLPRGRSLSGKFLLRLLSLGLDR